MKEPAIRNSAAIISEPYGTAKPKYQEILRLDKMLDAAEIYHDTIRNHDGWQVCYYGHGDMLLSDAIEHMYSYGQEHDRLEIMGMTDDGYDVQGYMTAEEVFEKWRKHWNEEK